MLSSHSSVDQPCVHDFHGIPTGNTDKPSPTCLQYSPINAKPYTVSQYVKQMWSGVLWTIEITSAAIMQFKLQAGMSKCSNAEKAADLSNSLRGTVATVLTYVSTSCEASASQALTAAHVFCFGVDLAKEFICQFGCLFCLQPNYCLEET